MHKKKATQPSQDNMIISGDPIKDSPTRSVLKAISWRVIASGTTFLITFVIFKRFTDRSFAETLETASWVTSFEVVSKIILYYLHERMWTNIGWGKKWRRNAWSRRKWKKLYRDMHQKTSSPEFQ